MGRKLLFCIQTCTKRVDVKHLIKESQLCCSGCTLAYLLKLINSKYFSHLPSVYAHGSHVLINNV